MQLPSTNLPFSKGKSFSMSLVFALTCFIVPTLAIPYPQEYKANNTFGSGLEARSLLFSRADTTPAADTYPGGAICSAYPFGASMGFNLRGGPNYDTSKCGFNGLKYNDDYTPSSLVSGFQEPPTVNELGTQYNRQCDHVLELQTILPWIFDTLTVTGFNTFCSELSGGLKSGRATATTLAAKIRNAVNIPQNLHSIPQDVNQLKGKLWQGQTTYSYDFGRLTIESYVDQITPSVDSIVQGIAGGLEDAYPGHGLNSAAAMADLSGRFNAKLTQMVTLVRASNLVKPPLACQAGQTPTSAPARRDEAEEWSIRSWFLRSMPSWKKSASPQDSEVEVLLADESKESELTTMEKRDPAPYWAEFCDDNGDNCSSAFDIWNPGCFSVDGTTVQFHGVAFNALYNSGLVTLVVSPDGGCPCQSSSQIFNIFDADTNTPYKLDNTGKSYRFVASSDTGNNCPVAPSPPSDPPITTVPEATPTTTIAPATPTTTTVAPVETTIEPPAPSGLQTAPDPGEAADNQLDAEAVVECESETTTTSEETTTTTTQKEDDPPEEGDGGGGDGLDFPGVNLPGGLSLPPFHLPSFPGPGGLNIGDPFGFVAIILPGTSSSIIVQSGGESSTVGSLPTNSPQPTLNTITTVDSNGQPTTIYSAQATPGQTPVLPTPTPTPPPQQTPITTTSTGLDGIPTTLVISTTTTTGADGLPTMMTTTVTPAAPVMTPPPNDGSPVTTTSTGLDGLPTVMVISVTTTTGADGLPTPVTSTVMPAATPPSTPAAITPAPGSPVTTTSTGADGLPTALTISVTSTMGVDGLPTLVTTTMTQGASPPAATPPPQATPPPSGDGSPVTTTSIGSDGLPTVLVSTVATTTGVDGLATVFTSTVTQGAAPVETPPPTTPEANPPASTPLPAGSGTFAKFCSDGEQNNCTPGYQLTQPTCFTIPDTSAAFITFCIVNQFDTQDDNYSLVVSPDASCGCQNNNQIVPVSVFNASETTNLQFTGGSYHWIAGTGSANTC